MKIVLLLFCLVGSMNLMAQEKMFIHKSDRISLGVWMSVVDSIKFGLDGSQASFHMKEEVAEYPVSDIDSISFGDNSSTIVVKYDQQGVAVINPLAFEGVDVTVNGSHVIVTSTTEMRDISYSLYGISDDGLFKIYSQKRFHILLNGVHLTNKEGPAINIQADKKATITLVDGTTSYLADGADYSAAPLTSDGAEEDQKAVIFSEGQLIFTGSGSMTINGTGVDKHAICSDEYISVENGTIIVTSAQKDGIHGKDGVEVTGGTITLSASEDGIDGNDGEILVSGGQITTTVSQPGVAGMVCDSTITINGGTIQMNVSGNHSKGISSDGAIALNGGSITIHTTGGVVLETSGSGKDPSYCTAIKSDSHVLLSGTNVLVVSSGTSGKGISAGGNIHMTGGEVNLTTSGSGGTFINSSGVTDSYSTSGMSADADIVLLGGTLTTTTLLSSASGGKGLSAEGTITIGDVNHSPTINITTKGSKFLVSGTDYCHPKALRSTGAIHILNGNTTLSSTDDAIHSDASITISGGNVTISASTEGIESKYIFLNGGTTSTTSSNDGYNATMGLVYQGTESNDNSYLYINGGTHAVNCTGGDAIDSNGNIVMSGGVVIANGSFSSSQEEAVDFNGTFKMNGGFMIGAGANSNMTKAMSSTSTQKNLYIISKSSVSNNSIIHIQNASGTDILTFKPVYGAYRFLFSSPELEAGTHSIYFGGMYTGGSSNNGLFTGGTYSAGTLKSSFTISGTVTTINVN